VIPAVLLARAPGLRRPRTVAAALLTTVVVLAPWTIFNMTRFTDPVPVSSTIGLVVSGANCPDTYDDGPQLGSWSVGCTGAKVPGDESQRSAGLRHLGTTYARNHLGRLPVVVAARLGRTYEFYVVEPKGFGPSWLKILTAGAWYAVFLLGVAGAFVLRRRGTTLLPVVATVVVVTLTVMLTWGSPRFRVPVDIVAIALAAAAIDHWWSRARADAAPEEVPAPAVA
jgi:hypothetical protein